MLWIQAAWHWTVTITVQVSIMVAFVSLVMVVMRHRMAARWMHGLWLLIFLRLLVPWSPPSPASLYNFVPLVGVHASIPSDRPHDRIPKSHAASNSGVAATGLDVTEILVALWLAGVVLLGVRITYHEWRFRQHLRVYTPWDGLTNGRSHDLTERPRMVETEAVDTPAVFGVIRPRILVPPGFQAQLTPAQWQHVLQHEQTHIQRQDLLVQWIVELLTMLYWFHPGVWLARYRIRETQEWAADEAVLSSLPTDRITEYGYTLLRVSEFRSRRLAVLNAAGLALHPSLTARRIWRVHHYGRVHRRWSWVAGIIGLGLATMVMTSAQSSRLSTEFGHAAHGSPSSSRPSNRIIDPFGEPPPTYPVNGRGQTYGPWPPGVPLADAPALVAVGDINGEPGYVKRDQLPQMSTGSTRSVGVPAEHVIPVYESNGRTVIGQFVVGQHVANSTATRPAPSDALRVHIF